VPNVTCDSGTNASRIARKPCGFVFSLFAKLPALPPSVFLPNIKNPIFLAHSVAGLHMLMLKPIFLKTRFSSEVVFPGKSDELQTENPINNSNRPAPQPVLPVTASGW
jgi:hypothetical protein